MRFLAVGHLQLNAKVAAFAAVMIALANALSAISLGLTRVGQIGLDFSSIAVFLAAIYGGPYLGFIVGLLGGIVPGINFGLLGGLGMLGLLGLPLGKSLTGLTTGLLYKYLKISRRSKPSLLTIPIVLVGYVPEFIFTIIFFIVLVPLVLGPAPWLTTGLLISILAKAWFETFVMSGFMGVLAGNMGFTTFVTGILASPKSPRILNNN